MKEKEVFVFIDNHRIVLHDKGEERMKPKIIKSDSIIIGRYWIQLEPTGVLRIAPAVHNPWNRVSVPASMTLINFDGLTLRVNVPCETKT